MGRRLPNAPQEIVTALWNGRPIQGRVRDTVAAALYAAGHRAFGRSRKYHEPRGLSGSFLAGHLATVDGIPRVRLDRATLVEGSDVRMHGAWPTPGLDIFRATRWMPRHMLWGGFEHTRAIPDHSVFWRPWERFLAVAAGEVAAPAPGHEIPGRRFSAKTVVVGGGQAGRQAANSAGEDTVLVTRGDCQGDLDDHVTLLTGYEVFALYDGGRLVAAAPFDPAKPAVLIDTDHVVLATGVRSLPPLVRGTALPGVLDATTALRLAEVYGVPAGDEVVVVGTDGKEGVADRLRDLGTNIVDVLPVESVRAILGRAEVQGFEAVPGTATCDAVVHAGPWQPDPSLKFQACWQGELRLIAGDMPLNLRVVGAAAKPAEPVHIGERLDREAYVCPCMDVTVAEVLRHIERGVTHVEELKRLTSCGMGPCQGVPCWALLTAVVAHATGTSPETVGHPTYRPPRAALTFGQAAGLADLTEAAK